MIIVIVSIENTSSLLLLCVFCVKAMEEERKSIHAVTLKTMTPEKYAALASAVTADTEASA